MDKILYIMFFFNCKNQYPTVFQNSDIRKLCGVLGMESEFHVRFNYLYRFS